VNSNASNTSARSSASSSAPSNTTVDWEELEKTEEQEPRDETTDEVCWKNCTNFAIGADITSLLPFCWLDWNKRMLRLWATQNLAL
jgi:hypothetical protein